MPMSMHQVRAANSNARRTPTTHGDQARARLSSAARLTWTIEATSHFQAMTLYYKHMGWGTYTTDQEWGLRTYAEHG